MTEVTLGYGGHKVNLTDLGHHKTFSQLHPEVQRRVMSLMEHAGGALGIGTGWRSSEVQERTFRDRYRSGWGNIHWNGQSWHKVHGANAAPPGRSFHEGVNNGMAMALDMVGDLGWMEAHAHAHGFLTFAHIGHEPWHIQPIELPHSVTQWRNAGMPQPNQFALPSQPHSWTPVAAWHGQIPAPTLKSGSKGDPVKSLQHHLAGWYHLGKYDVKDPGPIDGQFGSKVKASLKSMQLHVLRVADDGMYGPHTHEALVKLQVYLSHASTGTH